MKFIKIVLGILVGILIFWGLFFNFKKLNDKDEIPKISGFTMMEVESDGMNEKAKMGDFVLLKEQETYKEGDILLYQEGIYIKTGEIASIEGNRFAMKTDQNETIFTTTSTNIVGKVLFSIPGGGKVWNFLMNPIVVGILIIGTLGVIVQKLIAQ